jgi:hypothetical protein
MAPGIRAAGGSDFSSQPHLHDAQFQFVYVPKGWGEFGAHEVDAVNPAARRGDSR